MSQERNESDHADDCLTDELHQLGRLVVEFQGSHSALGVRFNPTLSKSGKHCVETSFKFIVLPV
jgi:hypothetical protein